MKWILITLFLFGINYSSFGQDLSKSTIFKITNDKKSVFHSSGTFHNGSVKGKSKLKAIRHSFSARKGYERVVFDFTTVHPPKVYGHISGADQKIYIDFFDTESVKFGNYTYGNSKYVEKVIFFPISGDSLAVELFLEVNPTVDIFTLNSPGRLVIDIKRN